jgi:hypothetical protein
VAIIKGAGSEWVGTAPDYEGTRKFIDAVVKDL